MIPYRIKHKPTGLYYKPGKPHLSRFGKVYGSNNNILNHLRNKEFVYVMSNKPTLTDLLKNLGYEIESQSALYGTRFKVRKSEFEIEYFD